MSQSDLCPRSEWCKCPVYRTRDHPETGRGNYAPAPLRHNHHQHLEQECPGPGTADQLWGSTPRKNPSSIRAEQFITISAVSSVSSVSPSSVCTSFPECGGRFRSTLHSYRILYSTIRSRERRLLRSFDRVTRQLQMDNIAGHLVNWGIWNFLYLESTLLTMSHST